MNLTIVYSILRSNQSEIFYNDIDSSWLIDGIYLFGFLPMGAISLVLNVISFVLISRIMVRNHFLYEYLRANTVISSLSCIIEIFQFTAFSPRYFEFVALSTYSRIFRCQVFSYSQTTLLFIISILDIFILIERLSDFNKKLKVFIILSPLKNIAITIVFCSLFNAQILIYEYPNPDETYYNEIGNISLNKTVHQCIQSDFFGSVYGIIMYIVIILVKDVFTLILEICGCILLFSYFRRFIRAHTSLSRNASVQHTTTAERTNNMTQKRKITLMVITLSTISIITHSSMIIVFLVYLFKIASSSILVILILFLSLKPFSNFFIFGIFDNNFKATFGEIIGYFWKKAFKSY